MQAPQRKLKDIKRLLSAFPATNSAADPALVLHNYLNAVEDHGADFVEDAVTAFIKGEVPGHDGRFVPTAPMLAGACRLVEERAARARYLAGLSAPKLPPPEIVKTDEQRARGREMMQAAIDNLASTTAHESAEALAAEKARWEKVNARFQPPMDDQSLMDRLIHKRGYDVGDADGDRDVA